MKNTNLPILYYVPTVTSMIDEVLSLMESTSKSSQAAYGTSIDCKCDSDKCSFCVELPGVKKENIKLTLDKNYITLEATKKNILLDKETKIKEKLWLANPERYKLEEISSKFEDGVLVIDIPKKEQEKPRELTVT